MSVSVHICVPVCTWEGGKQQRFKWRQKKAQITEAVGQFPRWKKLVESIIFQVINFSQKTVRISSITHNRTRDYISQAHLHSEMLNKLVEIIWGYSDSLKTIALSDFYSKCHLKKWIHGVLFVLILKTLWITSLFFKKKYANSNSSLLLWARQPSNWFWSLLHICNFCSVVHSSSHIQFQMQILQQRRLFLK